MPGICTGACVFGKCPNEVCVKYEQKGRKAGRINVSSNILMSDIGANIRTDKSGLGVAVDIGTTTVVLYLYDMGDVKCLSVKSALNPQIRLGVDVISRINYCGTVENGLKDMQDAVRSLINDLIMDACHEAGVDNIEIEDAVITGNTTMLHLLAGLSPVSMGHLPFTPESLFGFSRPAKELGLAMINADVYLTPCFSAFVGGDISSAVVASGMSEKDSVSLLLDLGTNGEVAVGNRNRLFVTSTAAGPAFEGSQIECGMAGVKGAVCSVYTLSGDILFETIGGAEPKGICGSGILDLTSLFVNLGAIDETGAIADAEDVPGEIRKYIGERDGSPSIELTEGVYLTQKDIRQIQTAKAAVAGGVRCLIHDSGFSEDEIENVYIAGGFGNFMDQESALAIGLIEDKYRGKIRCIGNAAGKGAAMALINHRYRKEGERVTGISEHVELGSNPYFMECYVECMMF
ncbi:MAG: DUF4445 domain-containing protein [Christensenellaceae bacterium]|nr:DUF4445 domain-containing protein [Christensenellaceae bacterium]